MSLTFIFVILPFFTYSGSYFGLVKISGKELIEGEYIIDVHRLDSGENGTANLMDTNFYVYDEIADRDTLVPLPNAWEEIKPDEEYRIVMEKKAFPYRWFSNSDYNLETFYLD